MKSYIDVTSQHSRKFVRYVYILCTVIDLPHSVQNSMNTTVFVELCSIEILQVAFMLSLHINNDHKSNRNKYLNMNQSH